MMTWGREEHFCEGDFGTFSARESTDGLMPFLILDEETAEHSAYFLIFIVTFCELVHDSRFAVEVGEDLRIGADSETLIFYDFS